MACLKNVTSLIEVALVCLKILAILIEAVIACFKAPEF
jgi:hypothetical protein